MANSSVTMIQKSNLLLTVFVPAMDFGFYESNELVPWVLNHDWGIFNV
jgi:hypothetical protein